MRNLWFAVAALGLLWTPTVWAGDGDKKDDAEVETALSKIAEAGPGVYAIQKDAQGRITSCIVVGQSRISTVLGAAKGKEIARERARLDASGQFVTWLKEKVSVHVKSDDQTTLFLEGAEGNDKDALKESGKAVESTSKTMDSVANGLIRGLQVLQVAVSARTGPAPFSWAGTPRTLRRPALSKRRTNRESRTSTPRSRTKPSRTRKSRTRSSPPTTLRSFCRTDGVLAAGGRPAAPWIFW